MEKRNQIYVLTGGPGFGKSTLIDYLKSLGYKVGDEVARDIIQEQQRIGGNILPGKDVRSFQLEVLKRRIAFYGSVNIGEIAFTDRAIPDQIAFARFNGFGTPDILVRKTKEFRYNEKVFVTPPWEAIYKNDMERTESFDKACELHEVIVGVYQEFGYSVVEIPCLNVHERVKFVLNLI